MGRTQHLRPICLKLLFFVSNRQSINTSASSYLSNQSSHRRFLTSSMEGKFSRCAAIVKICDVCAQMQNSAHANRVICELKINTLTLKSLNYGAWIQRVRIIVPHTKLLIESSSFQQCTNDPYQSHFLSWMTTDASRETETILPNIGKCKGNLGRTNTIDLGDQFQPMQVPWDFYAQSTYNCNQCKFAEICKPTLKHSWSSPTYKGRKMFYIRLASWRVKR